MVTTSSMTHTLAGHVFEAQPGSQTIITTKDHSTHLCPMSQNSKNTLDNFTSSSSSSSSFNSSTSTFNSPTSSSTNNQMIKLKSNCIQMFDSRSLLDSHLSYCILQISGCKITIDRPYQGPLIQNNHPKIFLRTNLLPSSNPLIKNRISQQIKTDIHSSSSVSGVLGHIPLPSYPQIIRSHPLLPYLFVGNSDNTLTIITPESFL